jgi:hypothetical protein
MAETSGRLTQLERNFTALHHNVEALKRDQVPRAATRLNLLEATVGDLVSHMNQNKAADSRRRQRRACFSDRAFWAFLAAALTAFLMTMAGDAEADAWDDLVAEARAERLANPSTTFRVPASHDPAAAQRAIRIIRRTPQRAPQAAARAEGWASAPQGVSGRSQAMEWKVRRAGR